MGIRTKLNLGLLLVFAVAFAAAWVFLDREFQHSARVQAVENARIMLSAANAVRDYTSVEVAPAITRGDPNVILPPTIPSYAAQVNLRRVQADFPDYSYKEAALNPTNLNDLARGWEADFIHAFRRDQTLTELMGERETPQGRVLTLARPVTIRDPACLTCHSTPERAPPRLVQVYGRVNGFGWQMNETIGAQLLTVPMALPLRNAELNLHSALAILLAVFAGLMLVLNLLLHLVIIRPMTRISAAATAVSLGQDVPPAAFAVAGRDEVAELGRAFTRMRRSLDQAVKMLSP
jgi:HAMP domain-containing protein